MNVISWLSTNFSNNFDMQGRMDDSQISQLD